MAVLDIEPGKAMSLAPNQGSNPRATKGRFDHRSAVRNGRIASARRWSATDLHRCGFRGGCCSLCFPRLNHGGHRLPHRFKVRLISLERVDIRKDLRFADLLMLLELLLHLMA